MAARSIGPYRVLSRLGSGGMGEVCLAEDTRLRRHVAIKTLLLDESSADQRSALLVEARAAARLSHRGIAAVYDVLEWDGQLHLVMEFVEGVPLSERLGPPALSAVECVRLAAALCDAVGHAHANGVVHCDLKPGNVILQRDGTPKILDFGLARMIDSITRTSAPADAVQPPTPASPARVRGTLAYMAPEVLEGRPPDERADIYSLGVMVYEMATGSRPFRSADRLELALAIVGRRPAAPSSLRPELGPDFDRLVLTAMAGDPDDRPRAAAQLGHDFAALAESLAPEARSSTAGSTTTTRGPRARAVAWLGGTVVATAALLSTHLVSRDASPGAGRLTPPVVLVAAAAHEASDDRALSGGFADLLAAELAGVPGLVVAAAAGAAASDAPSTLAAEHGATHVLVPSIRRLDRDTVQLGVRLHRASDAAVLWSRVVSGRPDEIADLQRSLGEAAVGALVQQRLITHVRGRTRVVGPSGEAPADFEAFEEYSQGRILQQRPDVPGNLERAVALFERAIQREPAFALAHAALARTYWTLYAWTRDSVWTDKARASALEALRLAPQAPDVRVMLAQIAHGSGRSDAAIEELETALAIEPESDDAQRLLGRILCDRGEVDLGLTHLEEARRLRAGYWDNYRALGLCHFRAGHYDAAIAAFTRFTELQPDSAWGYQTLGTAYHAAGRLDEALPQYQAALERAPSARAWSNIGTAHYQRGAFAQAVDAYLKAIALRPNEPVTHRNLADAYLRLDRTSDARASFARALELARRGLDVNPDDAALLALSAFCLARLGRHDEAQARSLRATTLAPKDKDVWYERAVVLAIGRRESEAIEALGRAVEHGYAWSWIESDVDLEAVRRLPAFASLRSGRGNP